MRVFSLLSLVVVLLIVAVVAKKQLGITQATAPAASAASGEVSAPVANNPQQAHQLTQQVQQDVNSMMQGRGGQLDQDLDKTQP
jgi:hypothetical protein